MPCQIFPPQEKNIMKVIRGRGIIRGGLFSQGGLFTQELIKTKAELFPRVGGMDHYPLVAEVS